MRGMDSRWHAAQQPCHGERAALLPVRGARRGGSATALRDADDFTDGARDDPASGRRPVRLPARWADRSPCPRAAGRTGADADRTAVPAGESSSENPGTRRCPFSTSGRPRHDHRMGQAPCAGRAHADAPDRQRDRPVVRKMAAAAPTADRGAGARCRRPGTAGIRRPGYESVTAFITMFKKALGLSPTRYFAARSRRQAAGAPDPDAQA